MSFNDKEKAFLLELEQLTRKHRIAIGGCGCCGSPFLIELKDEELVNEAGYGDDSSSDVSWISPADKYDWENYGNTILKADS